jgi:hypothetical protein
MSIYRVSLFVVAGLFTAAMTSAASAGCCGWGVQAPVVQTPIVYGSTGCGGCGTPSAAIVYAQPVAPAPPPVILNTGWGTGCGCHHNFVYAATPAIEVTPVEATPIYVVNQGPDYSGPGVMVPYHTWAPAGRYLGPAAYPYFHGYGTRRIWAPRAHVFFHTRFYGHPYWRGPARGYRWHG